MQTLNASRQYKYRSLPSDQILPENLWSVNGRDSNDGGCGVLEWCDGPIDAMGLMTKMSTYPQFKNLSVGKYYVPHGMQTVVSLVWGAQNAHEIIEDAPKQGGEFVYMSLGRPASGGKKQAYRVVCKLPIPFN